jgi:hypothetical protein
MKNIFCYLSIIFICNTINLTAEEKSSLVPLIYSTDLFQPPEDPDDHFDLAILSGIEEFDLKAIVFDLSTAWRNENEVAVGAVEQMSVITGKPLPPWAVGLRDPLTSPDDKAENQPEQYQGGVELILNTLREAEEKVLLFLVGSCRDFAVACNREPELLRQKVSAVYVSAGNGPDGIQFEWNVMLDPYAYLALMKSGLPIYWSPCFSQVNLRQATPEEVIEGNISTFNSYYVAPNQAELLEDTSGMLQNFFSYALNKLQDDPIQYLKQPPGTIPAKARNMWSTAAFIHAAGREIYYHKDKYVSCSLQKAKLLGISEQQKVDVYRFDNVHFTEMSVDLSGCLLDEKPVVPIFKGELNDTASSTKVFRYINPEYNLIMVSVLAELLREL